MSEGTDTASGETEETQDSTETNETPTLDIKSELAAFSSSILSQIDQKLAPKAPVLTQDDINKLWKENPAAAMQASLKKVVQEEINPLKHEILTESKRDSFDKKAQEDFPLLKTDKQFQKIVAEEAGKLISEGGYNKESPGLIHTAARLAAARYTKKAPTKGEGGMNGEAPTGSGGRPTREVSPENSIKNYAALKKMFIGDLTNKNTNEAKALERSEKNFLAKVKSGRWDKVYGK